MFITTVRGGREAKMLKNLSAEMVRSGISTRDIAAVIGKTQRSAQDKVRGAFPFSMPEAIKIRDSLFPGMTLEYLFATTDTKAN